MKIVLTQKITLLKKSEHIDVMKVFDSDAIPHKGDYIEDLAWKDPFEYEVEEVTINYKENQCYVELPEIIIDSNDRKDLESYIKELENFGWIETD